MISLLATTQKSFLSLNQKFYHKTAFLNVKYRHEYETTETISIRE